jgi:hypothetical protein
MITSRQALSQVEQAILGVRRDEDRLTTMLRSATEETARLRARQAEAYKALARLRLDELQANKVSGNLDTAERDALAVVEKGRTALAAIAAKRATLVDAIAAGEKTLDEHADRLEKAIDIVDDLAEKTRARLAGDKAWLDARDRVTSTEAMAQASAEKADQAEKDLAEKRKPYDADPIFSYLWKRGYGTSAYRAGFLARYFDRKIAKLVDYDKARPNYYMLTEIPVRLRDHATRLHEAIAAAKSELVALERKALEADGIAPLEAKAAAADDARKAFGAELDGMKAELAALDTEQAALLDPAGDHSLAKAIDGLAAAIAREDLAALHQEALQTPTPEDERIVATLKEIEPALRRREAEAEEVRKTAVALGKKRAELEESRASFHREGYDDPRGRFSNGPDIGSVIGGVLGGMLSSGNLNDAFGRGWSSPSRGSGSTFGGGIRFPGGGSSSRPSRPSAPSRPSSRGGFRTGGRF